MARARKAAGKGRKTKRRTKARGKSRATRSRAKARRSSARKSRRKPRNEGIVDKLASAVRVVTDTMQETAQLRQRMGTRGGINEG